MGSHFNLYKGILPGAIVLDASRCFYSDFHSTTEHERQLKEIASKWVLLGDREQTIVADTDGGCDRIEEVTYQHELCLSDAIFYDGQIVGFYLDFQFWNGSSQKPNSHTFMLNEPETHTHYNKKSTWRLVKKSI